MNAATDNTQIGGSATPAPPAPPVDEVFEGLKAQVIEAGKHDRYFGEDDLDEDFELVEETEWTQDYKYQSADAIFLHKPTGRHFEISNTRSGSYHTDWYYSAPSFREVKKTVKVIEKTVWEAV